MAVQMPQPEPEQEVESKPKDRMYDFRFNAFVEMGYSELDAEALALNHASPAQAREYVKAGCSLKDARDILL